MGHSFWLCCQTSHFNILVFQTVLNACLCVCSWIHKKKGKKKKIKKRILPDGHQCSLKARLMWPFTQRATALLCQTLKPQCPLSSNESSTVTEDERYKSPISWQTSISWMSEAEIVPVGAVSASKVNKPILSRAVWPNCASFFQSLQWFVCTWTEQKVSGWAVICYVQIG